MRSCTQHRRRQPARSSIGARRVADPYAFLRSVLILGGPRTLLLYAYTYVRTSRTYTE